MRLSREIRSKPDWERMRNRLDPLIVQQWRVEARDEGFPQANVDYVIAELEYYRSLRDGPIEPSPVDGVWQADAQIGRAHV